MAKGKKLSTEGDGPEQRQLPLQFAASIQGRMALGVEAGSRIGRLGCPVVEGAGAAVVKKKLCVELDGFNLHAAVRVGKDDRSALANLCRYARGR